MINKLLLVPCGAINSTTMRELGLETLIKEGPLAVAPAMWSEEDGITHYAFKFKLRLSELAVFNTAASNLSGCNVLGYADTENNNHVLSQLGMRVHPSA